MPNNHCLTFKLLPFVSMSLMRSSDQRLTSMSLKFTTSLRSIEITILSLFRKDAFGFRIGTRHTSPSPHTNTTSPQCTFRPSHNHSLHFNIPPCTSQPPFLSKCPINPTQLSMHHPKVRIPNCHCSPGKLPIHLLRHIIKEQFIYASFQYLPRQSFVVFEELQVAADDC